MSDIEAASAELDRRRPGLEKAFAYYDGSYPEEFTDARLARFIARTSPQDRFNFARLVVAAVLDRLTIQSVTGSDDEATAVLEDAWTGNALPLEANEFNRSALVYGRSFALVWPKKSGGIGIHRNNPLTTVIAYDEEEPREKLWAAKRWQVGTGDKRRTRVTLYYLDRIERWVSSGTEAKEQKDFVRYVADGQPWPAPNDFGFLPMFEFRPQLDARPEHRDAFGPQGLINKLIATHRASVDFYGFPMRWLTGEEMDTEDEAGNSKLKTGPGQLWKVEGKDVETGQYSPADPDVYLKPLREYVQSMATTTQTSMRRLTGGDWPSGEALRVADTSEVKRAEDRLASLDWTWREVGDAVLAMDEKTKGATCAVQWAPVESYDDLDKWEVVAAKLAAGVPLEEALVEAGYKREMVQAWLKGVPAAE